MYGRSVCASHRFRTPSWTRETRPAAMTSASPVCLALKLSCRRTLVDAHPSRALCLRSQLFGVCANAACVQQQHDAVECQDASCLCSATRHRAVDRNCRSCREPASSGYRPMSDAVAAFIGLLASRQQTSTELRVCSACLSHVASRQTVNGIGTWLTMSGIT